MPPKLDHVFAIQLYRNGTQSANGYRFLIGHRDHDTALRLARSAAHKAVNSLTRKENVYWRADIFKDGKIVDDVVYSLTVKGINFERVQDK